MLIEKSSNGYGIPRTVESMRVKVIEQNKSRSVWREQDTPEFLGDYIREEWRELNAELEEEQEKWSRWGIASEIGDIEYLCTRYEELVPDSPLPEEFAFFRAVAWQLATQLELEVADCVHLKIIRNDLKYPASICNMHSYEEGRQKCKQLWSIMGGDKAFYKWYEEVFGTI